MTTTPAPDRPGAAGGAGGAGAAPGGPGRAWSGGGAAAPAGGRRTPAWLWAALATLLLLHHDFWFWNQPRLVLGLPAGLLYHVIYCLAVAALMALAVHRAWPPPGIAEADVAGAAAGPRH